MKNIIGLTGPTGSGKSSFSLLAQQNGICVIDCDKLSRFVTQNGSECLLRLSEAFGKDIIKDGALDRRLLALRAFKNEETKALLEEITFPFILTEVFAQIEKSDKECVLLDAPTLFESGLDELCSCVIAVLSDSEIRKQRIIERDNLSREQAETRMAAGKNDDFYISRADYVIYNNSSVAEFLKQAQGIINTLVEE
ncbi:MAG: dephospho-CoA kinase [Clostridia bacterium]|nr:dephospho-CoA kinase [Clostridia bacterium]